MGLSIVSPFCWSMFIWTLTPRATPKVWFLLCARRFFTQDDFLHKAQIRPAQYCSRMSDEVKSTATSLEQVQRKAFGLIADLSLTSNPQSLFHPQATVLLPVLPLLFWLLLFGSSFTRDFLSFSYAGNQSPPPNLHPYFFSDFPHSLISKASSSHFYGNLQSLFLKAVSTNCILPECLHA